MMVFIKAGGQLRARLNPDIDFYTRKVEIEDGKSMADILKLIEIDQAFVAFIYVRGQVKDFSYIPSNGETIILQPPVSGG